MNLRWLQYCQSMCSRASVKQYRYWWVWNNIPNKWYVLLCSFLILPQRYFVTDRTDIRLLNRFILFRFPTLASRARRRPIMAGGWHGMGASCVSPSPGADMGWVRLGFPLSLEKILNFAYEMMPFTSCCNGICLLLDEILNLPSKWCNFQHRPSDMLWAQGGVSSRQRKFTNFAYEMVPYPEYFNWHGVGAGGRENLHFAYEMVPFPANFNWHVVGSGEREEF